VPPLVNAGTNSTLIEIACDNALDVMETFGLLREDFDLICAIATIDGEDDEFSKRISTVVRSALTRKFNSRCGRG